MKDDAPTLQRFARSSTPRGTRPQAVILPGSTADVQECVRIAAACGVPLYPISHGKNWGYGDACAVTDGQVILDLSRMNRIVEVHPQLGYAVLEPGVTQGQLHAYLLEHDSPFRMDMTGAGPDASIIGNLLERGFGHTPYGDHFRHACGMEVVLADGRVLETGFGAFAGAQATRVFPYGIGPWLDGLFTQSNLGIVTRLGVWLFPLPPVCQGFAFKVKRDEDLEAAVEALRELRLHNVIRSTIHIANDLRVVSAQRGYPWELTGGATPLPDTVRSALQAEGGVGAWNAMGGLYGTRRSVAAARHAVRKQLRHVAHVHFFGDREIRWGKRLVRLLRWIPPVAQLGKAVESAESVYRLLKGEPSLDPLRGVFWRMRTPPDMTKPDPAEAGFFWISPVLPMTGTACREVLDIAGPIYRRFQFEPLVTMTSITDRALVSVMSICYDKENPEEAVRAEACYDALFVALRDRGYIPYRVGIHSMPKLWPEGGTYGDVLSRIKQTLDAGNILAPGRYQPTRTGRVQDKTGRQK
ncbi:MAG: FAD-binding oxidoreductase [Candidatus Peribacteraceae bacterium]